MTVHRCPDGDARITPCCGRNPLELPRTDQMTLDPALVTCKPVVRCHYCGHVPGGAYCDPHNLQAPR